MKLTFGALTSLILIICANSRADEYKTSLKIIRSFVKHLSKSDSLVLVSVDPTRINLGVSKKRRADTSQAELLPEYKSIPVLEISRVTNRMAIKEISQEIATRLDKKPIAIAACVSWVGSLFAYFGGNVERIDFDDVNGYVYLERRNHLYQIYGSPKIWGVIMAKALGRTSTTKEPCRHDTYQDSLGSTSAGN